MRGIWRRFEGGVGCGCVGKGRVVVDWLLIWSWGVRATGGEDGPFDERALANYDSLERLESVISQTEEKNTAEEKHMLITTSIQNAPNEKTHE